MTYRPPQTDRWHRTPELPLLPSHRAVLAALKFVAGRGFFYYGVVTYARQCEDACFAVKLDILGKARELPNEHLAPHADLIVRGETVTDVRMTNRIPISLGD